MTTPTQGQCILSTPLQSISLDWHDHDKGSRLRAAYWLWFRRVTSEQPGLHALLNPGAGRPFRRTHGRRMIGF